MPMAESVWNLSQFISSLEEKDSFVVLNCVCDSWRGEKYLIIDIHIPQLIQFVSKSNPNPLSITHWLTSPEIIINYLELE